MPYSFVIYCHPETHVYKKAFTGKGLRDGFMSFLAQCDSQMVQRISEFKASPFTLSPLFGKVAKMAMPKGRPWNGKLIREKEFDHEGLITAGTPCRLRVSLLEDSIGKRVEGILKESRRGLSLIIGSTPLRIRDTLLSPESSDPWVSRKGYRELYDDASSSEKNVTLQFVTATALKRGSGSIPLPDPQLVFRGYLDHWRWFSIVPFSPDFLKVIKQSIHLTDFNISHTSYKTDYGKQHGFTGWCRFLLAGRHHERHIREFNALTDYAFYCGTGKNTYLGMGITRRV